MFFPRSQAASLLLERMLLLYYEGSICYFREAQGSVLTSCSLLGTPVYWPIAMPSEDILVVPVMAELAEPKLLLSKPVSNLGDPCLRQLVV